MLALSCGVREDFMFSSLIPIVLPMLVTASSLSPDSRNVVMLSCCNLMINKTSLNILHCFNYTDKAVIVAKLACYFKNNIKNI